MASTFEVLSQDEPRPQAARLGPFSTDQLECLLDDFDAWAAGPGRTFFLTRDWWFDSPCRDVPLLIDFYALVEAGIPAEQMRAHVQRDPLSVTFIGSPDRLPEPASRFRWPGDTECESELGPLLPFPFFAQSFEQEDGFPPQISVNIAARFEPTCQQYDWCCDILRSYEQRGFLVWWFHVAKPKVGISLREHSQHVQNGFKGMGVNSSERCRFPNDARGEITNGKHDKVDGKTIWPIELTGISNTLSQRFGQWPRRIDSLLFVLDKDKPRYLQKTSALFSWYAQFGLVTWYEKISGAVTQSQFFEHLCATTKQYAAIESLPHEPPIPDRFYLHPAPEPGDGSALNALLNRFAPETEHDRQLIAAMFATIIWGETGGQRPAFLLTADGGRGAGKTALAKMVALLAGGQFLISPTEDEARIKNRLLTPDSLTLRVALIDNIKSAKFSWDFLESLVTAHTISGHRLHFGNASRPNNLVWLLTVNGASLSTDMAQRCVTIKLDRPLRSGNWEETTVRFIRENRGPLIADLIGLLRRDKQPLEKFSRWARWEDEVLSRLENPSELQRLIVERQAGADAEADEWSLVEEHFYARLSDLHLEVDDSRLFIRFDIAYRWFLEGTGERNLTKNAVGRRIAQAINEERIKRLVPARCKSRGRGYQWNGKNAKGEVDYLSVDHALDQRRIIGGLGG